jgi:hypothetical protein
MAVLVISEFPGVTRAEAEQWAQGPVASGALRQPGLMLQADGPTDQGWRLISVWDWQADFRRLYDTTIKPNLPPGAPARDVVSELRDVVLPGREARS